MGLLKDIQLVALQVGFNLWEAELPDSTGQQGIGASVQRRIKLVIAFGWPQSMPRYNLLPILYGIPKTSQANHIPTIGPVRERERSIKVNMRLSANQPPLLVFQRKQTTLQSIIAICQLPSQCFP